MERKEFLLFAIFVAYWLFPLLAKKFMKKKNPKETRGGLVKVLDLIVALKGAGERLQGKGGLPTDVPQAPIVPQSIPLTVQQKDMAVSASENQSAGKLQMEPPAATLKKPYNEIAGLGKSFVTTPNKVAGVKKIPRKKLRDAVLWSEILGTPLGLRDNDVY